MAIAELEIQGRYDEAEHGFYFRPLPNMLSADDLARLDTWCASRPSTTMPPPTPGCWTCSALACR
jgi:hypothetical protein